ncbi:uncharacterized protein EDB93DRAFT_1102238 [Suillus bovinus]|uniref:uncharacterized protein n=1 Tax=Suillus bovinus TaxID=48563 RepID=UPI001B88604E|nr:uncharacterized protein EDB93DRAFT_1102238 [Suillus bovinus]KAG2154464.1 hypothetical protein EDB93DRAFT_1102238 [Suillus bovinus]
MTVLNISKLSFYVLLLSVAFAQILVVSAQDGIVVDDNGTLEGIRYPVTLFMYSDSNRSTRGYYFDETMILQGLICRSDFRLQCRSEACMCGSIMIVGHTFANVESAEEEIVKIESRCHSCCCHGHTQWLVQKCADESFVQKGFTALDRSGYMGTRNDGPILETMISTYQKGRSVVRASRSHPLHPLASVSFPQCHGQGSTSEDEAFEARGISLTGVVRP